MTTIVGVYYGNSPRGAVFGTDNIAEENGSGRMINTRKMVIDESEEFVIATTGLVDVEHDNLIEGILDREIDLKKVVKKRDFPELREVHMKRWCRKEPDKEKNTSLMIALRTKRDVSLYVAYPLGHITEVDQYFSSGSGGKLAFDYLARVVREKDLRLNSRRTVTQAYELTLGALREAQGDKYSRGIDLVVISTKGIRDIGTQRKTVLEKAEKQFDERIRTSLARSRKNTT